MPKFLRRDEVAWRGEWRLHSVATRRYLHVLGSGSVHFDEMHFEGPRQYGPLAPAVQDAPSAAAALHVPLVIAEQVPAASQSVNFVGATKLSAPHVFPLLASASAMHFFEKVLQPTPCARSQSS